MEFAFIAKHRHIWPVSWLCEVLEVSPSGFHAWLSRPPGTREIHDATFVQRSRPASRSVTTPMALAASGGMFWRRGLPAGFTGSNG